MPNFASKDRTIMNNKLNIKIEQLKNTNNIELNLPINLMIIHLIVKSQYPMMEKKILGQKPVEDGVVVQLI